MEDSIITTRDYQGNVIREGTNYLAVVVKVSNKSKSAKVLDTDNFWLDIGGEYIYPTLDRSGKFLDVLIDTSGCLLNMIIYYFRKRKIS